MAIMESLITQAMSKNGNDQNRRAIIIEKPTTLMRNDTRNDQNHQTIEVKSKNQGCLVIVVKRDILSHLVMKRQMMTVVVLKKKTRALKRLSLSLSLSLSMMKDQQRQILRLQMVFPLGLALHQRESHPVHSNALRPLMILPLKAYSKGE